MDKGFLGPMVKIAIYDRYLSTLGGGERYSCKMAEILSKSKDYSVELLTDIYCEKDEISKRLNLDLDAVKLRIFGYISDEYAKKITSGYDVFINATYLSSLKGHAKKNIYLCYFPTPFDVDFRFIHRVLMLFFRLPARWLYRLSDRINRKNLESIEINEGLYDVKRFILGRGSWSNGKIKAIIKGDDTIFNLGFKNPDVPGSPLSMKTSIQVIEKDSKDKVFDKRISISRGEKVSTGFRLVKGKDYMLSVISDTFYPDKAEKGVLDSRRLGVVMYNELKKGFIKKILLKLIGFIPLFLVTFPRDLSFLKTYDTILAISMYSKHWIKRLWKRESTLLFPPVDIDSFRPGVKDKMILSVGRFFPEHHNKKQLELAKAFIEMLKEDPAATKGYSLWLVGGLSDRPSHIEYVEKIKGIIKDYPIKLKTNCPWEELMDIFSRSSIFWHASGMGEEEEKHPERFEHFGITTVEAMASGCIPIVIDKGGQKEIIEHGSNGFLFEDLKGLKDHTMEVISGNTDSEAIRKNALESCRKFSNENFSSRLLEIIEKTAG